MRGERNARKQGMLLACVLTTGCVNILAAYVWRHTEATWFGWVFTITFMLDSLLNLTIALRIIKAYGTNANEPELPQYMPSVQMEISGDVKLVEKICP
jgi:hypothetical protein